MKQYIWVGVSLWVGSLVACEDQNTFITGRLGRPTGLAYVERVSQTGPNGEELRRSDILLADTEAEGVSVIQFVQGFDDDRESVFERPEYFLPSSAVFFDLAISAPGFPTKVLVSPATDAEPELAFVLSTTNSRIYILNVAEAPYRSSADELEVAGSNQRLGTIDLNQLENIVGVPTDIALMGRSGAGTERVLVTFEGPGRGAPSLLVMLDLSLGSPGEMEEVDRIEVSEGAYSVVYRDEEQAALVSSAATSSVSVVALSEDDGFLSSESIYVFGPTRQVVNFGPTGVLAIRSDRGAVAWLRPTADGFERPDIVMPSPEDGRDLTVAEQEPGVLTLENEDRVSSPVTAGYTRAAQIGPPNTEDYLVVDADEERDVALFVSSNGDVFYVTEGDSGQPILPVSNGVNRVDIDVVVAPVVAPAAGEEASDEVLSFVGCEETLSSGPEALCTADGTGQFPDASCGEMVLRDSERPLRAGQGAVNYPFRVSVRGNLLTGTVGQASFEADSIDAEGQSLVATITDIRGANFDNFLLRSQAQTETVPDRVRVELSLLCGEEDTNGSPTTVEVTFGGILVSTDTSENNQAQIQAELDNVLATTAPSEEFIFENCIDALSGSPASPPSNRPVIRLRRYWVHIPDEVDEAVLVQLATPREGSSVEGIVEVFERAPIEADPDDASQYWLRFGQEPSSESPVRFEVVGSQDLGCRSEVIAPSADEVSEGGGYCGTPSDCASGWACVRPGRCPGTCVCENNAQAANCASSDFVRACPRLDFRIGAIHNRYRLGRGNSPETDRATLPDDVVYSNHRESFFVSFPGAQTLVEVSASTSTTGRGVAQIR